MGADKDAGSPANLPDAQFAPTMIPGQFAQATEQATGIEIPGYSELMVAGHGALGIVYKGV